MIAHKIQYPISLLISAYYFLRFQYKRMVLHSLMYSLIPEPGKSNTLFLLQTKVFWLFAIAYIPAYFLWALCLPISSRVYIFVGLTARRGN